MEQPVAGGVQLASIDEENEVSQSQQDQVIIPIFMLAQATPAEPAVPSPYLLLEGHREEYIEFGIPLYEASVKADWRAAKKILEEKPTLIRSSITENGETALHVAASAKRTKRVVAFVQNLVNMMTKEDLELKNNSSNTALCLAAAAGNVEMVKIMIRKNPVLLIIPGSQQMMPLYMAALFGDHDVVEYLYNQSSQLRDDGWTAQNRDLLLQKCVEGDLFDIALRIVNDRPELSSNRSVLGILAKKPDAFSGESLNFITRIIRWGHFHVSALLLRLPIRLIHSNLKVRTKDSDALQLLKIIWQNIAKKSKNEIDDILEGPPDSIKSGSGTAVQMILQQLIFDHLDKLEKEAYKITEDAEHVLILKHFLSKHVVNLHAETQSLVNQYNIPDEDQVWKTQQLISEYIAKILDETQRLFERGAEKEDQAQKLRNLISDNIAEMRCKAIIKKTYSSRVMFIAAELGNTNFLLELIRLSPDLISKVNDNGLSIFHIAVKHRFEGIYNLLYEIGAMKNTVTPMTDRDGNNMLHLAAMSTRKKNLEDVSGAALQMQREILWFKEVERMIPRSYRERKNKDGFTPRELFTKEHQDLITQAEKWMKATASQCMVVATLIATIVFAAAFTVPGGYGQNDGIPMFSRKLSFVAFVVADAISLFLSSASILTFLSILTSRYAERDFVRSLPMKLMAGLATLFLSIGAMMVTFSVSFFVLYHKEMKWIPIFISIFAITPAILYVALQYHLLIDVFRSTYGGKYLFKPEKQVLFYENPKY